MAMIEVVGVSKKYGSVKALDNISFSIEEKEVVGFLGPNGAGKTTALKIITTYLTQDEGKVRVGGWDTLENPLEVRELIGYLPEHNPLYLDMTVESYLNFMGEARALSGTRLKERIDYVRERCNIGDVFHKKISMLSKGYRHRVGLAAALIHDPKILILDEPTTGLDPIQIIDIRKLIKELAQEKTIIFSTHILPEITHVCKKIIVIANGKIVAHDTFENLKKSTLEKHNLIVELITPQDVVSDLAAIQGVQDAKLLEKENGVYKYRLTTAGGDLEEKVVELANRNSWKIYHLFPEEVSLEDIFIKLATQKGGEAK